MLRNEELARALALARDDGMLNIYGPPGVGRSWLARAVADALGTQRTAHVAAQRQTIEGLRVAVAASLGLGWSGGSRDGFLEAIASVPQSVVVLDDVDVLASEVAGECREWAVAAPTCTVITTSLVRLDTPFTFALEPLDVERARAMFAERAAALTRHPQPLDGALVDQLVQHLDGLPLAIELAAARLRVLSLKDLVARIDERFAALGSRDGETLARAVGSAWALVEPEYQQTLSELTVLGATFELAAAEAVTTAGRSALAHIDALIDRSMLRAAPETSIAGESRFAIYETVAEFVREEAPADETTHQKYRAWVLGFAGELLRAADAGGAGESVNWPSLARLLEPLVDDPHSAAAAGLLIDRVLDRTATDAVRLDMLGRALSQAEQPESRARLLTASGTAAVARGELDDAATLLNDAIEAGRGCGDEELYALALMRRGDLARRRGNAGDAIMYLAQAMDLTTNRDLMRLCRAHLSCCHVDADNDDAARDVLSALAGARPAEPIVECEVCLRAAYAQFYLGNHVEQRRLAEHARSLARSTGHLRWEAVATQTTGDAANMLGDFADATRNYRQAQQMLRELGDVHHRAVLLGNLGSTHHRSGALYEAAFCYREALAMHRRSGAAPYEAVVATSLGILEIERGQFDEAAHLLKHSAQLNADLGQLDDVGAAELALGWLELRRGSNGASSFQRAADAFEAADEPAWSAVASLLASPTTAPEPLRRQVRARGDEVALALLAEAERVARAKGAAVRPIESTYQGHSLHVRLARLVARADVSDSPRVDPEQEQVTLRVAADASWFEIGQHHVDLRRRRAHRAILLSLVERRGEPLDVYEAFELGWPHDKAGAEAAADRVYWVVGTLRRQGLRDVVITSDDGYFLEPAVRVEVID